MHDTFAKSVRDLGTEAVLADVQVLKLVERLQVLEKGTHGALVLNHVAFEGE